MKASALAPPEVEKKRVDFDVMYDFRAGGKDGAVIKQGFLKKQGNSHKNWKRRWFYLNNSAISYFKSKKDPLPVGVIEIGSVHDVTADAIDKRTKYNIQLHTPTRTYQIQAESQEEQESWLRALKRNHDLFRGGQLDKFVQKAWHDSELQSRGARGNTHLVELYGKHLSYSRSYTADATVATDVCTWHIDDIKYTRDAKNERMTVKPLEEDSAEHHIELSTLDTRGQGASDFLNELQEALEHNRRIEPRGLKQLYEEFFTSQGVEDVPGNVLSWVENWPIRYKRGLLSVAVGHNDSRSLWVQVGGLLLSYYDKPDSLKPMGTVELAKIGVQLEHHEEDRSPDTIVLKLGGDSNAKTWISLSGYNISSLKSASDLNRVEWVVSLCGNTVRLGKQPRLVVDSKLVRFKRGWMKRDGIKIWCELDEFTLRFYNTAKALSWSASVLLLTVADLKATPTDLSFRTLGGEEYCLCFESLATEWKNAIENNISILKQIMTGKAPLPTASMLNSSCLAKAPLDTTQSGEISVNPVRRSTTAEIDPDEIMLVTKLGDGCFGTVHRGVCRANDVAVKIPLVQQLDEVQLSLLRTEVEIMSANPHPNIVLFMGACTIPGQFKIVTELMDGDLDTLLKKSGLRFTLFDKMRMAKDAALGVNWLHCSNPPIIHRDLKTANLLYKKTGTSYRVKVCDFGLSVIKPKSTMKDQGGAKGTPLYMAPEVMMQEEFDEKADVYSFGIVLWEILTGKDPYPHHSDYSQFVRAIVEDEERPPLPEDCPIHLRQLVDGCWDPYPENRPDFEEISTALDEITIEVAIYEPTACCFWMRYFLKEFTVPWVDFVVALYEYLDDTPMPEVFVSDEARYFKGRCIGSGSYFTPADCSYKCLKALLAEKETFGEEREVVQIETFNQFVEWFGPLKSAGLLSRVRATLAQSWFHGDLNAADAEKMLGREGVGSFLGFVLDDEHRYPSLDLLIQALQGPLRLGKACEGSRYQRIFSDPYYIPLAPGDTAGNYGLVSDVILNLPSSAH